MNNTNQDGLLEIMRGCPRRESIYYLDQVRVLKAVALTVDWLQGQTKHKK